jgi:hypothetical protein
MATLSKKLAPLVAFLALVLAGCGDVRVCLGSCGGQSAPPFTATLTPTYLLAWRGETAAGPLIVDIYSEYPIPFTVSVCLRKQDDSFPPPGIYLTGTDPGNPWSCLTGNVRETARYELLMTVRPDAAPGIYYLRLQVANEAFVRNLDFTLEVR